MKNTVNSVVFAFCIFIMIFIASLLMTGCNEEDVKPIELHLFEGTWEVVFSDNQNIIDRDCILEITSESIGSAESGYEKSGRIITYYVNGGGIKFYDKEFSWIVREFGDDEPLLELILLEELDGNDPWDGYYYYKIVKLNDTHMWWKAYSHGNKSTIKMRRRTDL